MKPDKLLKSLNIKQRQAVTSVANNLLILAGAGSGKTKVLVHRIAWLILVKNISPYSILALTFTNKASIEMRYRIENLIGSVQDGMWIGTFHGLAHRLLRIHYLDANLPKDFQIIDSDDQLRLLKSIIKSLDLDEKRWSPKQAMAFINNKKDQGYRPKNIEKKYNYVEHIWQNIYQSYQKMINRSGLIDFSEILLRAYELWINKPKILNDYQNRFSHILIDEFQDTNSVQYCWIRDLSKKKSKLMIVGDDDQSIYGWRGAQVGNIQKFLKDFQGSEIIRLEQNYRSTPYILISANTLIANNQERMGKNLWTSKKKGDPIYIYKAFNELDEANFVSNQIQYWLSKGKQLKDCAILYRSNKLSRILEETLLQKKIPYNIYGGQRFFERKEIKDSLAYLRLITNRNDDVAFTRVINTPPRGIGERSLSILKKAAKDNKSTLWSMTLILLQKKILLGRAEKKFIAFIELINSLDYQTSNMSLHLQTEQVIRSSGIWSMYKKQNSEKAQTRIENLEELVNATQQYNCNKKDKYETTLQSFLADIILDLGETQKNDFKDAVQMMTLHSAKGLEFLMIFIIGMEEGIFPNKMSLEKQGSLEEERRLAYVGITRAIKKITLCYTKKRRIYGKEVNSFPSRFIKELPEDCIKKIKYNTKYYHNYFSYLKK